MKYDQSNNPYSHLDTQKDVFRQLVNLHPSSIRPEELAFTLGDRKIDSIPPDVLLALQKCPSEDRGLLLLDAIRADLARYKSYKSDESVNSVSDIARCAGAALVRLLRHQFPSIRRSAAEILAQVGAASELAFIPMAVLGRTGTQSDLRLTNIFEHKLSDDKRGLFYQYKRVAEQFGELRAADFIRHLSDQQNLDWWSNAKGKFIVLGGLCHRDYDVVRASLNTIVKSSADPSYPRPFWHPHMPPSLKPDSKLCYASYLQTEAMLALSSSFILNETTPIEHRRLFLQACSGLASSPFLGAVIEEYVGTLLRETNLGDQHGIDSGHALYVAATLLPTELRFSPITKLIKLVDHPNDEVALIAFNTLWDLPYLINNLPRASRIQTATQLFRLLKRECKSSRDEIRCETVADMIGNIRGIDAHLQKFVENLITTMRGNSLAQDAYHRILRGLFDNTADEALRERLRRYIEGQH